MASTWATDIPILSWERFSRLKSGIASLAMGSSMGVAPSPNDDD